MTNHIKFLAGLIISVLFTACTTSADVTDIPSQYDHPFAGRMIVESLTPEQVETRCTGSWDIAWWQRVASCEWVFPDRLHPGKQTAHFIYPQWKYVGTDELVRLIRIETANANGWGEAKRLTH